jgi:hypothetical protein
MRKVLPTGWMQTHSASRALPRCSEVVGRPQRSRTQGESSCSCQGVTRRYSRDEDTHRETPDMMRTCQQILQPWQLKIVVDDLTCTFVEGTSRRHMTWLMVQRFSSNPTPFSYNSMHTRQRSQRRERRKSGEGRRVRQTRTRRHASGVRVLTGDDAFVPTPEPRSAHVPIGR